MRKTPSHVQPNHHKWHDISSARQLYFSCLGPIYISSLFVVLCLSVIWACTLTVKQGSRKTPLIRFMPHHRLGCSLCPLPPDHTLSLSTKSLPFHSGPDPRYPGGLRLEDDPSLIASTNPTNIWGTHPKKTSKMAYSKLALEFRFYTWTFFSRVSLS